MIFTQFFWFLVLFVHLCAFQRSWVRCAFKNVNTSANCIVSLILKLYFLNDAFGSLLTTFPQFTLPSRLASCHPPSSEGLVCVEALALKINIHLKKRNGTTVPYSDIEEILYLNNLLLRQSIPQLFCRQNNCSLYTREP